VRSGGGERSSGSTWGWWRPLSATVTRRCQWIQGDEHQHIREVQHRRSHRDGGAAGLSSSRYPSSSIPRRRPRSPPSAAAHGDDGSPWQQDVVPLLPVPRKRRALMGPTGGRAGQRGGAAGEAAFSQLLHDRTALESAFSGRCRITLEAKLFSPPFGTASPEAARNLLAKPCQRDPYRCQRA
jgi:hypothetical protein